MNLYSAYELFIGEIGYCKKIGYNKARFIKTGLAIVIKKGDQNYKYHDIITNKTYIFFESRLCREGDLAITQIYPLPILITKACKEIKNSDLLNYFKDKVLKDQKIPKNKIKELFLILNGPEDQNNIIEQEDNFDNKTIDSTNKNNNINTINNYSTILTNKEFRNEPAIGRDDKIKEIIITLAQDKKNPILVGESGTGKTTIVDQLAYKIQNNNIPNFLKKQMIIEIDLANLLAGTRYLGTLEEKFTNVINFAIKNNAILFIDEIHTIYGAGTHSKSDYDVAAMIKQAIDRQGLKVIGTTTIEEYSKYFSNDALKRRFEKIQIPEPTDEILFQIINKLFYDYSENNNIKLLPNTNNIIYNLIELTKSKHRTWDDKICNPDLVIGIIDKIFADAKVNDQTELTIENIIYGINSCNRVYESCKQQIIDKLNIEQKDNKKAKIIQFKKRK